MLEPLYLEEIPEYTPKIVFDAEEGVFEISGDILNDNQSFHDMILDWLKSYAKSPNACTTFRFYLYYMSDKGWQLVKNMIGILKTLPDIVIVWQAENEDFKEHGEELSEELAFPFKYIVM